MKLTEKIEFAENNGYCLAMFIDGKLIEKHLDINDYPELQDIEVNNEPYVKIVLKTGKTICVHQTYEFVLWNSIQWIEDFGD